MNRLTSSILLGAGLFGVVTLNADCSNIVPEGAGDTASDSASAIWSDKPNVVFVLTDDLAWNLVQYMPHVQQMQKRGVTFSNYFVTDSLCCPSRSSIFTGKYPHDTQVFGNTGPMGGYQQFKRKGNQTQTFAVALKGGGYQTAMMGKYLNGYQTADPSDPGWTGWAVADKGYHEFDYVLNQNGKQVSYGSAAKDYLVDVLSGLGGELIAQEAAHPFLLEIATFAPHSPYTPAPRDVGTMHEKVPRTPAYNHPNKNPPKWLEEYGPLDEAQIARLDGDFNLRAEAVQSVDKMIGELFDKLKAAGTLDRTYVVFSSDNGYHMGDHQMLSGKETAFDHDIRVPLIVVGPGVPAGKTIDAIVENIDLCPTFADLAGTAAPHTADGRSIVPLLHGQEIADWRNVALIEHAGDDKAPMEHDDPDKETATRLRPTTYEAIRMQDSVFVKYADGETEYYDIAKDPYELNNTAASLPSATVKTFEHTLSAIKNCHSSSECWTAQHMP